MITLYIALIMLYWIGLACLFGFVEAYYFYFLSQSADRRGEQDDHAILSVIRISVALPCLVIVFLLTMLWVISAGVALFFLFVFPYFHDGSYFVTRNSFVKGTYPDGWRSNVDGRAAWDFTWKERKVMLFTSIAIFVFTLAYSLWL